MNLANTSLLDKPRAIEATDPGALADAPDVPEDRVTSRARRLAAVRAGARRAALVLTVLMIVGVGLWLMTLSAVQRTAGSHVLDPDLPDPVVQPVEEDPPSGSGPSDAASTEETRPSVVTPTVSEDWVRQVSARTGIPARATEAYGRAQLQVDADTPGCGLSWNTLAAIGAVESANGTHNGTVLLESGRTSRPIRGPLLSGRGVGAVRDTDGGRWDGNTRWDRALGPMQFIPSTWRRWASDGNGDGVADPDQIDDAALTAARYLCSSGRMNTTQGWLAAVYAYNHSSSYVERVAETANSYAAETS